MITPGPGGGGGTNPQLANAFQYTGASAMTLTNVTPANIAAGSGNTNITLTGSAFDNTCVVWYKDNPIGGGGAWHSLTTTFGGSATSLSAVMPSSYFAAATYGGTLGQVKVVKSATEVIWSGNISVQLNTLTITTASLPAASRGGSYSSTLAATGGDGVYTWSADGTDLLTNFGLTISSGGLISGTVSGTATAQNITFRVTDSGARTTTKALFISVDGGSVSITSPAPDPAEIDPITIGQNSFTTRFIGSGGTPSSYAWTLVGGALPQGLQLSRDTNYDGIFTGTVVNQVITSPFLFTVRLTDGSTTDTKSFRIRVLPQPSSVTVTGVSPSFGPTAGATPVTITGTGFLANATVLFGTTAANSVVVVSSTTITCNVPAGSLGFVTVRVTNSDGGTNTLLNGYEYRALISPVPTGIDIQDGPFAGGQTVTITGSNFTGLTSVKFGVSEANSVPATGIVVEAGGTQARVVTPAYVLADGTTRVDVNIYMTNATGTGIFPADVDTGYAFRPPPIITGILPNQGPTTGGQTIYVLGKNFFQRGTSKPRIFIGGVEIPNSQIELIES
jgi:hypothetical protein